MKIFFSYIKVIAMKLNVFLFLKNKLNSNFRIDILVGNDLLR